MEKEVMKKMARYVELSEKFSKSERDIFTEEELRNCHINNASFGMASSIGVGQPFEFNTTLHIDGREIYIDEKGNLKAKDDKKPLTRGQELEATTMLKVKVRATILDEYDEYIKLRASLKSYFDGVNKLINE